LAITEKLTQLHLLANGQGKYGKSIKECGKVTRYQGIQMQKYFSFNPFKKDLKSEIKINDLIF